MSDSIKNTTDESCPVFKSWKSWYTLVIVCNLVVVMAIYFYFKSL